MSETSLLEILDQVHSLREQLEAWGFSAYTLLILAFLSVLGLILSTREILSWYLKTSAVQNEVRTLHLKINQLQRTIQEFQEEWYSDDLDDEDTPAEQNKPSGGKGAKRITRLRLDH